MRRRPPREGVSLTWRGRALLAAGVVGLVVAYSVGIDALFLVSILLLAAVVASALAARHRRPSLAVHRSFGAERAMPGHPVPVQIDVANRALQAVGQATWTDEWSWHSPAGMLARRVAGASSPAELPLLRGRWGDVHRSVTVTWDFVPPRRGDFEIGPARVTVMDPFGLASATVVAGDSTALTVFPRVAELEESLSTPRRADGQAHRADHRATGGEHELTTRVYRVGDPLRRVHWRASARHGELMVRQEEQRSAAEVTVLLETRRSGHPDVDSGDSDRSESFEWCVSMAASLAVHLDAQGFRVHLLETGVPQLPVAAGPSLAGLARVALTPFARTTGVTLVPSGRQASARLGSAFAVLGDLDDDTIADLIAARSAYDEAIAWLPTSVPGFALERLAAAGWLCIPVSARTPVEEAWRLAQNQRMHRDAG
ncbi:DUF58 domain-containing protein [Salinibacterium sp. GXW1014]|uniref:DUF58 domain-containing protein n=1 Tax=Salinibacterium sp. GXW1014 TaxID=3377838 RepID=UPI00383AAB93